MTGALHGIAVALYAAAVLLLGLSLTRGDRRLPAIATVVAALGVGVHLGALAAYTTALGEPPLVGLGPSLSVLALLVALGAVVASTLWRAGQVGLVLAPVAAVLTASAQYVGLHPAGEPLAFRGPWLVLHVLLAMGGYAGLTVAFAAGLLYVVQVRELKAKHFGAVFRFLPPLDTLDRVGRAALLAGLPFLTVSLLVGWAWTARFQHPLSPGNPKVIWGVLTWLVFVLALGARANGGGRRGAMASVAGFVVVVVSYLLLRAAVSGGGAFL